MKPSAFLVVSRWEYLPSAINEVGIPALLALLVVPFSPTYALMVTLGLVFWWMGHLIGSHVNCLTDYEGDKLFKSRLAHAVDQIGTQRLRRIIKLESILLSAGAALLAVLLRLPMLAVFWFLGLFLAFAYSCPPLRLKGRGWWNPLALGLVLYVCPMFFVYNLLTRSFSTFSAAVIVLFSLQMVPMFLMDEISDREEDAQFGIRNPCVVHGRPRTILCSIVMYVLSTSGLVFLVLTRHELQGVANWVRIVLAVGFFGYVTADFVRLHRMSARLLRSPDDALLARLKTTVRTPVWLMGSGLATLLVVSVTLVRLQ